MSDLSTSLISGDAVALRRWTEPAGRAGEPHTRPYETVGTVVSGRVEVHVGSDVSVCGPGDSYRVPAGSERQYVVVEDLDAIEATAPPAD